jgi:hypothetical protein
MSRRGLAAIAALSLLCGGAGSAAALTLAATADTFVSDDSPMSNFGNFSFVEVGVFGLPKAAIVRGLLTFDLTALAPGPVGRARLQFVLTDANPDPPNFSITVTRLATGFGENTVTWDTQPADVAAPSAITVVTQAIGSVVTIDITALVQAQRLSAMPDSLSLRIAATEETPFDPFDERFFDFATKEADPPQPALLLIDAVTAAPTMSGLAWLLLLPALTAVGALGLRRMGD